MLLKSGASFRSFNKKTFIFKTLRESEWVFFISCRLENVHLALKFFIGGTQLGGDRGILYCRGKNLVGLCRRTQHKIRVIQRRAYGLRDEEYLRLKVLTCMLPEI